MTNRLPVAKPMCGEDIENYAQSFLEKFQPKVLKEPMAIDIESLFEFDLSKAFKIQTDYDALKPNIYGYTDFKKKKIVISSYLIDDIHKTKFTRSTIAHEMGHAILHIKQFRRQSYIAMSINEGTDENNLYRAEESEIPIYKNPEWQAWRFAGALLMPEKPFRIAFKATGGNVEKLSEIFNVNPAFVKTRIRALKIKKGDTAISPFFI